ncbi:uncharacterized protein LOC113477649 [Athene cunicularia]|uniref:uncharacterized protein LOC113477649 n=1 Tax=Athene cunicularia TaxID=194338 RepID=UPI000EF6603D|nr:uncharacterized protein LOC113477649 [Athene cunicularia]
MSKEDIIILKYGTQMKINFNKGRTAGRLPVLPWGPVTSLSGNPGWKRAARCLNLPFIFKQQFGLFFVSHSPLTDRPRRRREWCSLYLKLVLPRSWHCSCLPGGASAKIPSPPSTGNTISRSGNSLSLCPTSGGWWHFPATEVLFARSPPPPGPKPLWSLRGAERFACLDRSCGLQEKELPWQKPAGPQVQSQFIHSAPYVSTPTNPFCWCGCTSCFSHPLPLISCQLVSPSPTVRVGVVWMAA